MTTKQILVFEDDPQLQKIMRITLEEAGYEVESFSNGADGENRMKETAPDLVLMDVMMPGKNGLDICGDAKKDPDLQSIPIIMMTCMTESSSRDDDYWQKETGADAFLTKPFPLTNLIELVRKLLDN